MEYQPSQMELERQKRIEHNKLRMMEIGLSQAVDELQASQQAEAAKAAPRKRTVVERVFVAEEDLRRSGREKKTVNYNEHAFFKAAEQALEDTKPKRRYLVAKTRTITEGGGGRAVRCSGWSPCMGSAGFNAMERCHEAAEKCAEELANTTFVKPLTQSMVSGGFWCNAPRGMTQAVAQQLGVDYKCSLMAYLPEGQSVPEDACHTNLAGDGWTMVWLPRKGEFGFSGGWRSFSLDMKLFPGDCVVVELVPKAQHRGEQDTRFTIILHVFRALEYETEVEAAARQAAAAAAAAVKVEDGEEDGMQAQEAVAVRPEDQPTQLLAQEEWQEPRPEGSPAAVGAAAAELSGEPQQAQQAQQGGSPQQAQQAQQGGKRKRQAQLAEGGAKRNRRSLSVDGKKASPAAAAAQAATGAGRKATRAPKAAAKAASQAQAGGSAAAGKKGRAGGKQKQGEGAAAAAAGKHAAGAGRKRQSKKAAAVVEEESYDVERIMAVRQRDDGGKEYLIKWLGWDEAWNTWEPRAHLDRPLTEYLLGPGLALADLE